MDDVDGAVGQAGSVVAERHTHRPDGNEILLAEPVTVAHRRLLSSSPGRPRYVAT